MATPINNSIINNLSDADRKALVNTLLFLVLASDYTNKDLDYLEFVNMVGDLSVIERESNLGIAEDVIKNGSSDYKQELKETLYKNGLLYNYHVDILKEDLRLVAALAKLEHLRNL